MKKLAALLAFALALVGAILLTQYYTRRYASPPPPPPPPPAAPAPLATGSGSLNAPPTSGSYTDVGAKSPITSSKTRVATLDLAAGKGHLTLRLEHAPSAPVPASVWVWAYFFSPDAPGRYCAGDPVELKQPFGKGIQLEAVTVNVDLPVRDCPAPRSPSSTFYTRVNVSTESAFAARLAEPRVSYDISQASPVVLEGKK